MLGKQQEFAAGQNTLNRDNQWAMADFEAGRAMERARLEREARAKEFEATHGLAQRVEDRMTLDRNMKGWDTAKTFMMEMPKNQAEIERLKAVAANEAAQQKLYEAQTSALSQTVSPEALALMGALNPKLAPVIAANPGMTNIPVSTLGKVLAAREGTSGQMNPEILKLLLGDQVGAGAPVSTNTVQRIKLR